MPLPTFTAGRRLRASELTQLRTMLNSFSQSGVGTCSAALTLTTTLTDVTGCSVTATTTGSNAFAIVTASVQFVVSVAGAGVTLACALLVDGANQAALGTLRDNADVVHDRHHAFTWKIPLPTPGAHVFKLQGNKSAAGSTSSISNTAGTNIVVTIYDLP